MTIALQGTSAAVSSSGATSATITWPGSPSGQMLVGIFGFEAVTSGPWITGTNQGGWARSCYQAPSASGNGLEVWNTNGWSSGATTQFNFTGTLAYVGIGRVYTGQYTGAGNVLRAGTTAQVTGNNPAAPSIYAYINEMVVVCAASQLNSSGYTAAPTGYADLSSAARGSAHGNVEIGTADQVATGEGNTGSLTFTATAAAGGTKGATATLVIRGGPAVVAATSPLISIEYATPVT